MTHAEEPASDDVTPASSAAPLAGPDAEICYATEANMNWRERAAPIIAKTIERVGRDDQKALRRALRNAYPFGERAHHPYKAWCAEVRAQLGNEFMRSDMTAEKAGQVDAFK